MMTPPKVISLVSIKEADNLRKSLELKLFYNFTLNIRAQIQFQITNSCLGLQQFLIALLILDVDIHLKSQPFNPACCNNLRFPHFFGCIPAIFYPYGRFVEVNFGTFLG